MLRGTYYIDGTYQRGHLLPDFPLLLHSPIVHVWILHIVMRNFLCVCMHTKANFPLLNIGTQSDKKKLYSLHLSLVVVNLSPLAHFGMDMVWTKKSLIDKKRYLRLWAALRQSSPLLYDKIFSSSQLLHPLGILHRTRKYIFSSSDQGAQRAHQLRTRKDLVIQKRR